MESPNILDAAVVLTAALIFVWLRGKKSSATPLPPGPKKLPLLENLLDMPTEREWVKFTKWGNQFGMYSRIICASLLDVFVQEIWFRYRSLDSIISLSTRPRLL